MAQAHICQIIVNISTLETFLIKYYSYWYNLSCIIKYINTHSTKQQVMIVCFLCLQVPMLTLSGHSEAVSAVEFIDPCEVCTASWDHTIRLWDLERAVQKTLLVKMHF